MIRILRKPDDDKEFVGVVSLILSASVALYRPREVFVVHIDNWFDGKWLAFSGKAIGAIGVCNRKQLTIPPFVLNRLSFEQHFTLDARRGNYVSHDIKTLVRRRLHRSHSSSENLNRYIRDISDSAIFFWFSGASAKTRRGSLMLYRVADGQTSSWYASYHRATTWKLLHTLNISRAELLHLAESNILAFPAASSLPEDVRG
jgi:hypothetical protein